jgi:hypothetical protein
MRSGGRFRAAAAADLMADITMAGWARIWRGVKWSTVMPHAVIRAWRASVRS